MKSLAILTVSMLLSSLTFAGEYHNWIGTSAHIDCKSIQNGSESTIVKKSKANVIQDDEGYDSIRDIEILAKVQLTYAQVTRKYVIDSVLVDILSEEEVANNVSSRPTIVTGKHPKTGEKFKLEIEQNFYDMEYSPSVLTIGIKKQNYNQLECRIIHAG